MEVCGVNNINPLLIDDVVETVFEYLKLSDLKRCRLVCHTWCLVANKWLPLKCKQSILFGDGKKQFDTFLKLAQSSFHPLPQRKITIQSSILSLNRSQSLEAFFKTCGAFLHSLFLTYQDNSHQLTDKNNNLGESQTLFPKLELPHLKHFHYEELPISYFEGESKRGSLKGHLLFDRLLKACINLERLDLILQDTEIAKTELHFQSLVNCPSLKLRTLMLKLPLQDYHFELLKKARLYSLLNIQLRFQNEQCSATSPLQFLQSCSNSLRTLSTNIWMKGFSDRKVDDIHLPCLPKVDTLELSQWRSFIGNQDSLPFTFSYKSSFPSLRKLILQSHSWERCWNAFLPKETCYTLRELKLPKMLESCKSTVIPKVSKTFPNITKLDVTVIPSSVEVLSEIFCFLSGLEELSVNFLHGSSSRYLNENNRQSICIDYVMTGIPEATCKQIYSQDNIMSWMDRLETGYSIASLEHLKSLQLKNLSSVNYGIPQFTDITGYLGLMGLKKLRTLYIWRSQMSDECILELEKRFKLFLHPNF